MSKRQPRPSDKPYVGPVVTTDAVVLRIDGGELAVLVHTRPHAPFDGNLALPGVYVARNETIGAATQRCLKSKVSLDVPGGAHRATLSVYDNVNRDPRGHALSVVTATVMPTGWSGPCDGVWLNAHHLTGLAFDHDTIVADAVGWLQQHLWRERGVLAALVGDQPLTTATLLRVAEAVEGAAVHKSNLRTKAVSSGLVETTGESAPAVGRGRPSTMLRWTTPT